MTLTLETTLEEYMKYHWNRTKEARGKLQMLEIEFRFIWMRNYYQERCELLEGVIKMNKLIELLKDKDVRVTCGDNWLVWGVPVYSIKERDLFDDVGWVVYSRKRYEKKTRLLYCGVDLNVAIKYLESER